MQDIHITFPLDQLEPMVAAFEAQFAAQPEEVTILAWGCSWKQEVGCLILEWMDEVDEAFIQQLTADHSILDFSVYDVPCSADDPLIDPYLPLC